MYSYVLRLCVGVWCCVCGWRVECWRMCLLVFVCVLCALCLVRVKYTEDVFIVNIK
jgi:hypothetical protein